MKKNYSQEKVVVNKEGGHLKTLLRKKKMIKRKMHIIQFANNFFLLRPFVEHENILHS